MGEMRARILNHVYANPGVHFSAIGRDLGVSTGQAQYHLRKLRQSGDVIRQKVCGRTHYYSPKYSAWERGVLALFRRETAREILVRLLEEGSSRPSTLADDVGVARSTVEWHLSNLEQYDVVEKNHGSDGVTVELNRPIEVRRLLEEVDPRLSERLVDRFSTLVDQLLEE